MFCAGYPKIIRTKKNRSHLNLENNNCPRFKTYFIIASRRIIKCMLETSLWACQSKFSIPATLYKLIRRTHLACSPLQLFKTVIVQSVLVLLFSEDKEACVQHRMSHRETLCSILLARKPPKINPFKCKYLPTAHVNLFSYIESLTCYYINYERLERLTEECI